MQMVESNDINDSFGSLINSLRVGGYYNFVPKVTFYPTIQKEGNVCIIRYVCFYVLLYYKLK